MQRSEADAGTPPYANGSGSMALGLVGKVVIPLVIGGILGGLALNTRQEVTANSLAEHKVAEEQRLRELKDQLTSLRVEFLVELRELRQAVERRR